MAIKNILDKELEKTIFLEFFYGKKIVGEHFLTENRKLIFEKHGILPNIDEYIDIFIDYINTLTFRDETQTIYLTDNIWEDIPNCFFKNVNIKIEYKETDETNIKGSFIGVVGDLEDNQLPLLKGKFILNCDSYSIDKNVSTIFAHELTHAYEEFKRKENGAESMFDYAKRIKYPDNVDRHSSLNMIKRVISNLVYYTTKFEIRAYIASIYGTLRQNATDISSAHDAFEIIKNTVAYNNYVIIGKNIDYLWEVLDSSTVKTIQHAWYNATGEKKDPFLILTEIERRYNKQWKKFKRTCAKIAYDVYEKHSNTFTIDSNNSVNN